VIIDAARDAEHSAALDENADPVAAAIRQFLSERGKAEKSRGADHSEIVGMRCATGAG